MPTIFSKIISGEIPSYKIDENNYCYAFLDINPKQKGHVLVVPKVEVDKVYDLDNDQYIELMKFAKKISIAIQKTKFAHRVGLLVEGLEIPHSHIHLIPISKPGDLHAKAKTFSNDEMVEIAEMIKNNL